MLEYDFLEKGYKFASCKCEAFYGFNGTIKINEDPTSITQDNSSNFNLCA